jgi:hypothetical protein
VPSKVARSVGERGSGAVGAACAGVSSPLVMKTEPVSGCTGPATVVGGSRESPTFLTEVQVLRQLLACDKNRPVTEVTPRREGGDLV